MNNIIEGKWGITTVSTEVQRIIWDCFEQRCARTEKPREKKIEVFLDSCNLPRLNHRDIYNLKISVMDSEMGLVCKKVPQQRKIQNQMTSLLSLPNSHCFSPNYSKHWKQRNPSLPSSLSKASIALIPKSQKGTTKRELQTTMPDKHRSKKSQQSI